MDASKHIFNHTGSIPPAFSSQSFFPLKNLPVVYSAHYCLEKSCPWNNLFNDVDKTFLRLMCSGDIHRPQTLRALSDCSCWGTGQRLRDFRQCVQVGFREKKLGDRGVCVQKQIPLRSVYVYNYLTSNAQGQSTTAGSCPDVPRWLHMYTLMHLGGLWLTFSSKKTLCPLFHILVTYRILKGSTCNNWTKHRVCYSDLFTQKKPLRFLWSSTWGGWSQQQSFDEQEVLFQIQLYILLVLWR